MNIPTPVKNHLPRFIKHPLIAGTDWYWKTRSLPAQSLKDIAIFKEILSSVTGSKIHVLEWGAGRSTFFYPEYLSSIGRDFSWRAMENSAEWHRICTAKLAKTQLKDKVLIDCFNFPPFWDLDGYDPDPSLLAAEYDNNPNVESYVNHPLGLETEFDLIIIDGRFRRRCLLAAREAMAPGGLVVLHDAQNAHYHSSLSNFPRVEFLETGNLPGTSQRSTIAICAVDSSPIFDRILSKYGAEVSTSRRFAGR